MGYWEEKKEYKKELKKKEGMTKTKCPMNKNVEVVWQNSRLGLSICSFSGLANCNYCIKKKKYPPKDIGK